MSSGWSLPLLKPLLVIRQRMPTDCQGGSQPTVRLSLTQMLHSCASILQELTTAVPTEENKGAGRGSEVKNGKKIGKEEGRSKGTFSSWGVGRRAMQNLDSKWVTALIS